MHVEAILTDSPSGTAPPAYLRHGGVPTGEMGAIVVRQSVRCVAERQAA